MCVAGTGAGAGAGATWAAAVALTNTEGEADAGSELATSGAATTAAFEATAAADAAVESLRVVSFEEGADRLRSSTLRVERRVGAGRAGEAVADADAAFPPLFLPRGAATPMVVPAASATAERAGSAAASGAAGETAGAASCELTAADADESDVAEGIAASSGCGGASASAAEAETDLPGAVFLPFPNLPLPFAVGPDGSNAAGAVATSPAWAPEDDADAATSEPCAYTSGVAEDELGPADDT